MRSFLNSITLCVLLSSLALAGGTKRGVQMTKNQIIVCLGNSITEQGEAPDGYVSIMRKAFNVIHPELKTIIVNSGIGGHKSPDMAARFKRDVLDYQPDWVTISVGINDVWHGFYDNHPNGDGPLGIPLDDFTAYVTKMIRDAKSQKIKVMLFTTTVIGENLASPENQKLIPYNDALRALAKKFGCLLADQNAAFDSVLAPLQKPGMASEGVLTTDGVHMLPAGNRLMAKTALLAFGFPPERLESAWPAIDSLIQAQNTTGSENPEEGEKRMLFYGSPDRHWQLAWNFPDRAFRSACTRGEPLRRLAAGFKEQIKAARPTIAAVFLDGAADFHSAEAKRWVGLMARTANRELISAGFVVPWGGRKFPKALTWLRDTCLWYGFSLVHAELKSVGRWVADSAEAAPVAISAGGLFADSATVSMRPLLSSGELYYAFDDTVPTRKSHRYTRPFRIGETTVLNAIVYWPKHDSSGLRREGWKKVELLPAAAVAHTEPGLMYEYFEGDWKALPVFDSLGVVRQGQIPGIDIAAVKAQGDRWGAVFTGYIDVPENGLYTFFLTSDDGSRLLIDGKKVVDNNGIHGMLEAQGQMALARGMHRLRLDYFNGGGGEMLSLQWKGPGLSKQVVREEQFRH